MKIERKILVNKKTGQLTITLPKKAMDFLKKDNPKSVKLEIKKSAFKW